jgi:hypothetical protein
MSLSALIDPNTCLTGVYHRHQRNTNTPHEVMEFDCEILQMEPTQVADVEIYVNGMFIESAQWDPKAKELVEQEDGMMFSPAPCMHFIPVTKCPLMGRDIINAQCWQ